ncbi:21742_t:CDS:2 [Gigaspora margarita]|uniref:21742_t:CDS:1 n=1 Tax=Gigaspora margarita TaxID=4874 RepID=A0ABM8VXK4_GIGMA|nr:21742_t:CDS:2 [Gigaspora margarita]
MGITLSKFRKDKKGAEFDATSQYLYTLTGKAKVYDREHENIALRHNIVREIFNSNFLSPIHSELKAGGLKVLDVGCGFGTWLFEMSSDFPNSSYIGVDLTPQLFTATRPKNVDFLTANVTERLPFNDDSFDFVFIRNMAYDIQESQWKFLIQECTRVLKCGGYIEITEAELQALNCGPLLKKLSKKFFEYITSTKVNLLITEKMEEILISTNKFQDIAHYHRPFALGCWPSHLREAYRSYSNDVFRSVIKFSDVKEKDYDNTIKDLINEANKYRTYFNMHKYFSQKIEA